MEKSSSGLINALDDGELTAYVHYLLVNPEYQKDGIGTRLVEMIKQKYKDYLCIVLTAENRDWWVIMKSLDLMLCMTHFL